MLAGDPFRELRRVNTLTLSVKNLTATIEEEESRAPGASGRACQKPGSHQRRGANTQILPPEGRTLPTEGCSQQDTDALSGR